jgi:hypothetical protein
MGNQTEQSFFKGKSTKGKKKTMKKSLTFLAIKEM